MTRRAANERRVGPATDDARLLSVDGLTIEFDTEDGALRAVDDVTFSLARGETVSIVGESGSGKTVTAQAIIGTLPMPPGRLVRGSVTFDGTDVLALRPARRRALAGARISMISQDAQSALDGRFTVGYQIGEMFRHHRGWSWRRSKQAAIELLDRVRIPNAAARVNDYPHQFSGGMQQRAVIATAIALDPDLLIADEPTTALDVTVQAEIMALLQELKNELGLSMILVTHDLAQAYEISDRVLVMYAGRIVEEGTRDRLFASPAHPYARGLFAATPRVDSRDETLQVIPGTTPNLIALPPGCAFAPRCPYAQPICREEVPPRLTVAEGHTSACYFARDVVALGDPRRRDDRLVTLEEGTR